MSGPLDFPAAFEPPSTEQKAAKDSAPKKAPGTAGRATPLQGRLQEAIGGVGILVCLLNEIDGLAIIEGAERLSIALDKAAKQNPAVKRTLEAVLTGSVWGEVAFAAGAIALPIGVNHGMIPAGLVGRLPGFVEVPYAENGAGPHSE